MFSFYFELMARRGYLDALLARHPNGQPTTTYNSFLTHLDKQLKAAPIALLDAPSTLPPIGDLASDASAPTGVPGAAELGLPPINPAVILPGGETEALARMDAHIRRTEWIAKFEKPMTSPTEMDAFGARTRSTTALSPYLKFGCLSPRLLRA